MKKPYLHLIAILIFASCDQTQQTEDIKNLPKNEAGLIQLFNTINNKISDGVNEAGKKPVIDSGDVRIANYIHKDLNIQVDQWKGYIEKVSASTSDDNVFDVNVFIPLKGSYDKDHPTFDAINLKCQVTSDNKIMMPVVKTLQPFDKVIITGTFKTMEDGYVSFSHTGITPDELDFSWPNFTVILEGIKKSQ